MSTQSLQAEMMTSIYVEGLRFLLLLAELNMVWTLCIIYGVNHVGILGSIWCEWYVGCTVYGVNDVGIVGSIARETQLNCFRHNCYLKISSSCYIYFKPELQ